MTNLKGISVYVYRWFSRGNVISCTDGPSSKFDNFILIIHGDNTLPFEPNEKTPPLFLVRRNISGKEYLHLQPTKDGRYVFGGNFAFSSDSRFCRISQYPLPIHDRKLD